MKPNSAFSGGVAVLSDRRRGGWPPVLRYLMLMVVAGVATGCAGDVAMKNPRTGEIQTCQGSLFGLNPWSQTMACVAGDEAQGWTRASQE